MNCHHVNFEMNRRDFFGRFALGMGGMALFGLLNRDAFAAAPAVNPFKGILDQPHFAPKAKRIIYLFMSGGPSQHDLFDYKPLLNKLNGQDLPASVRMGQRLTGMSGNQATLPLAGSLFKFAQHGQSGAWVSELMPQTAKMADELCFIRSMHTEHINHDPAITFFQTGHQLPGRPSMGAWLSYGLGSANENLPGFVVLISKDRIDQPLYSRLWGNGFLSSIHQGVQFRAGKDPVLFLKNPDGISSESRRKMLDRLAELHALQYEDLGDPEINSRVAQYEMAYRMQTSVPDVMDLSKESDATFELYGRKRGSRAPSPRTVFSPADWPSATSASSSFIIRAGTITAGCPVAFAVRPRMSIKRAMPSSTISNSAVCSTTRSWFGVENLVAPITPKANSPPRITGATITRAVSRCGCAGAG